MVEPIDKLIMAHGSKVTGWQPLTTKIPTCVAQVSTTSHDTQTPFSLWPSTCSPTHCFNVWTIQFVWADLISSSFVTIKWFSSSGGSCLHSRTPAANHHEPQIPRLVLASSNWQSSLATVNPVRIFMPRASKFFTWPWILNWIAKLIKVTQPCLLTGPQFSLSHQA